MLHLGQGALFPRERELEPQHVRDDRGVEGRSLLDMKVPLERKMRYEPNSIFQNVMIAPKRALSCSSSARRLNGRLDRHAGACKGSL
jgi:hypothetical protein